MNHTQVSIEATEEQQEILIAVLSELEAVGFEQTENTLIAYFDENNFPSYDVSAALDGYTFYTTTIAEKNWNAEWESNFEPVIVDDFCAVRAHFHQPIKGVQHDILITPKMSFGTGHHATTYMMMQQMRELDFMGKSVFDFGTGTGVLAILAEKLGAAAVLAIDNDKWSIENGNENAANNNCKRVEMVLQDVVPSGQAFDIILANINRNVILHFISDLKKAVVPGGFILFSGLLIADENDIVEACSQQALQLVKQTQKSGWISILFVNSI
ncbi:MAG: hypothetical protein JWP69_765 [Flaviaesturariibacter sp.]|nr:hypothetical protein [Flaviaesturariibacter sp.]